MPSKLSFRTVPEGATSAVSTVSARAPWMGYTPDLDVAHVGANHNRTVDNLVPKVDDAGLGEFLGNFPGYDHADSTYGDSSQTGPAGLGDDGDSTQDIVGLFTFSRTNSVGIMAGEYDLTTLAVTAGDGSSAGSGQLWRLIPSTNIWQELTHLSASSSAALTAGYPSDSVTSQLCDYAVVPFGATPRTDLTALTAGEPSIVFTNGLDNVMIYSVPDVSPGTSEKGHYQELTEIFGTGANGFKAQSLEVWGDRLNFLNTHEGGTHYRQRLRRTAIGNADPDPVNDGGGAIDFRDFQGEGLRVEALGNVLACYFEDGVAFVRRTGESDAPYVKQIITTDRGLLSTHSMCNLGGGVHFGLFTDGWFYLSESGKFQEIGLTDIEGIPTRKWTRTFFERLDIEQRSRIDCVYDPAQRGIWLTLPLDGNSENAECWFYDIQGNRLFTRSEAITKFGVSNLQIKSGLTVGPGGGAATIGGLGDLTIGELQVTIGSWAARFGIKHLLLGDKSGQVFKQDISITTTIGTSSGTASEPSWKYGTVLTGLGQSRNLKSVREVLVQQIKASNQSFSATIKGNPSGLSKTQVFTNNTGTIGDVQTLARGFRYAAEQMSLELTGTAPFKMRSFEIDVQDTGSRKRIDG